MGTVPFKLRIHAKDDVFDTTKQKMNALEETKKHDWYVELEHISHQKAQHNNPNPMERFI
jgi:hypothetical protein